MGMYARIILHIGFLCSLMIILAAWSQVGAPKAVAILADGLLYRLQTREVQVASVLREANIFLYPGDEVTPPLTAALAEETAILVQRGDTFIQARDKLLLDDSRPATSAVSQLPTGNVASTSSAIPSAAADKEPAFQFGAASPNGDGQALQDATARVSRSIFVHTFGLVTEVNTTETSVQEALIKGGFSVGPADLVLPHKDTPVQQGQHVFLRNATPLSLQVNGQSKPIHTLAETVEQVLQRNNISLGPGDEITPELTTKVTPDMTISVVKMSGRIEVEERTIPFSTKYVADNQIEYGEQVVTRAGATGIHKREYYVEYQDRQKAHKMLQREWTAQEAVDAEIHYGTKIILRVLETPAGSLQYWRKMRVWATWYSPSTAGAGTVPGDHWYGMTRLGYEVQRGVIAVDPNVIPMRTGMYVPGYGIGLAVDTGGGIIGNMIDLGFADDDEKTWPTKWVDIYLLGSGPDPDSIQPPES